MRWNARLRRICCANAGLVRKLFIPRTSHYGDYRQQQPVARRSEYSEKTPNWARPTLEALAAHKAGLILPEASTPTSQSQELIARAKGQVQVSAVRMMTPLGSRFVLLLRRSIDVRQAPRAAPGCGPCPC